MSGWSGASRGLGLAIRFATLELKLWNFIDALEWRYSPDQPRVPGRQCEWGAVGGCGGRPWRTAIWPSSQCRSRSSIDEQLPLRVQSS